MNRRNYVRTVATGVAVVFSCMSLALPASAVAVGTSNERLSSLEDHFFQHPYDTENDSQRLGRLEILVFGQRRTGTDDERLAALQRAVTEKQVAGMPARTSQPANGTPAETLTPFSSKSIEPTRQANNSQPGSSPPVAPAYSQARQAPQAQPLSGNIEQTVTALESQVMGETHREQSLAARVSSLETTVGAQQGGGSLMERVNRIKVAVGNEGDLPSGAAASAPASAYKQGYTSQMGVTHPPAAPKVSNGHPVLKKAAEAALVVGAVAGVAALTIMATKGMGGGRHFHKLDLD